MIKRFLFWFLIFFSIFFFIESFTQKPAEQTNTPTNITLNTAKKAYTVGDRIMLTLFNGREEAVTISLDCPNEPLNVYMREDSQWVRQEATTNTPCENEITIDSKQSRNIEYGPWNYDLFNKKGEYKIELVLSTPATETEESLIYQADTTFEVKNRGIMGTVWTEGFYRPIYNTLIFFALYAPGHNFGISIILLTLVIRLILLVPNQKALRSQREMQKIQPELEAIKRKYEGNQEMISKKTMEMWKQHKVNPMGSCLPLLIQLPILIALFYVAQNGLDHFTLHLLYGPLQSFDTTLINTKFLWMDLANVDRIILPVTVALLQFGQMKLLSAGIKKQGDEKKNDLQSAMHNMNKMMTYVMPVIIGVMTASFPASVGLYWGCSTLFGIGQQMVVNKEKKGNKRKKDDGVRIIDVTPKS